MIRFLKAFLIFVVLYHIVVTVIGYGALHGAYPQLPALTRDGIWLLFFGIIAAAHITSISAYLRRWKRPRITLIVILIFGVGISLLKGKAPYDIFVGIKYGLLYLFIFLSSTFIGWICSGQQTNRYIGFIKRLLIITIIGWFLRQGLKFIRPDLFMHIGYGPFNDFKFWVNPPIYYLTGYKGTPRRQGIFSWPNNYGYFLIAFLPVVILFFRQKLETLKDFFTADKKTILNTAVIILRVIAIILTLSRTAYIWWIVALALLNIRWIKTHKRIARGILVLLIAGVIWLSFLKGASTIGHIKAKFGSIQYVIDQPSGYGLGTSGPAVNYNGTILPENYFIQLMLDIGTIGFLLRTVLILQITAIARAIQKAYTSRKTGTNTEITYLIRRWLNIGWICLLIMGIFLHVFEDSMINYLFFVTWWILTGYLSTYIKKITNEWLMMNE